MKQEKADELLDEAIQYGELGDLQYALSKHANVETDDGFGNTGIHRFSGRTNIDGLILMIQAGGDVNRLNVRNEPPMRSAIIGGSMHMPDLQLLTVKFLLSKNAEIPEGASGWAREKGRNELADYLDAIQAGTQERPVFEELLAEWQERNKLTGAEVHGRVAADNTMTKEKKSGHCH